MTINKSLPFRASSFNRSSMFSESLEERPDVGSSRNRMAGSLISSSEILSLFALSSAYLFIQRRSYLHIPYLIKPQVL